MKKHTNCLICNSDQLQKLDKYYEKHTLVKCSSCDFVFIQRIPTIEELEAYYSQYAYSEDVYISPLTIQSYNALLDEFEKYRKTNKILDVGCGRGWFLEAAKLRGWEVYGTEYSEKAKEVCEKNGIHIELGQLLADTFTPEAFDVITSFEVIEHINNPLEEMTNIHSFLRKGGLFYCTTPNFNSILRYYLKENFNVIEYPEHLSYYTKDTLNMLMKKFGLRNVKFLTTGISITRFKTSQKADSEEKLMDEESSDEKLRKKLSGKWYLRMLKDLINYGLTLTNLGLTLKGYYVKE